MFEDLTKFSRLTRRPKADIVREGIDLVLAKIEEQLEAEQIGREMMDEGKQ